MLLQVAIVQHDVVGNLDHVPWLYSYMMPLVALDRVGLAFGHLPLLYEATLRIERGERVSIVGRNGVGKSTLLRLVNGEQPPDTGSIWKEPGLRIARLEQDVPF